MLRQSIASTLLALALPACGGDSSPDSGGSGGSNGGPALTGGDASLTEGTGSPGGGGGTGTAPVGGNTGQMGTGGTGQTIDLSEPVVVDDCAPDVTSLSEAQVAALKAGGPVGSARLLYPYDGTAFPRGIGSPLFMWEGVRAEAVYVHIEAREFEYHGCLAPTAEGQLQLPQRVWEAAGQKTFGKTDPYTVEVSWLSGDGVSGPVSQQWIMAQATLKGSVYYNSYQPVGQIYRIPPGGEAERFGSIECHGCHSVSANGERMTAMTIAAVIPGGRTFDISGGSPEQLATPPSTPYAALTPDGTKYVSNSLATEVARSIGTTATYLVVAGVDSKLHDTATGEVLPSQGIPTGALMPSFSPDGRTLVFTDYAVGGGQALAKVTFDDATNTASDYVELYQDGDADMRPGWPFVLPDNGAVVFVNTDGDDFSGDGAGVEGLDVEAGPYSELFMVDVDSGESTLLARAMGYDSVADAQSGNTYLPFGEQDIRRAYFPTVSPVAAGGYFWVFFDAVRHYGNMGQSRQLWGTAVEIAPDGDYSVDRSRPAFYLPGQQFGTGNHRAFTALDPCLKDGEGCSSGVDCCGGYCVFPEGQDEFGGAAGTCASQIDTCASADQRCETAADCCPGEAGESLVCINNFCAPLQLL